MLDNEDNQLPSVWSRRKQSERPDWLTSDGQTSNSNRTNGQFVRVDANEPLLDGFILLRLAQMLNVDVFYIEVEDESEQKQKQQSKQQQRQAQRQRRQHSSSGVALSESKQHLVESATTNWGPDSEAGYSGERRRASRTVDGSEHESGGAGECSTELVPTHLSIGPTLKSTAVRQTTFESQQIENSEDAQCSQQQQPPPSKTLLDELAEICPLKGYIEGNSWMASLLRLVRIGLSLLAIMISVDKTISTILLCLISKPDIKTRPGTIGLAYETSDVNMSWLVLIALNISSMFIIYSTVFRGHQLWELLSQRLFLVSRTFQYKTMLSMFVFIYLEYIINISFVNNLFGWSFETNDNDVASDGPGGARWHKGAGGASGSTNLQGNIVNSYSVLSNIKTFVTEKDDANLPLDVLLTIFQFARGIIRIGPYITINYVTICLNEHIKTIRNQTLLTESLKRTQKLRMVVKSKRARLTAGRSGRTGAGGGDDVYGGTGTMPLGQLSQPALIQGQPLNGRKKRVIFVTDASGSQPQDTTSLRPPSALANGSGPGLSPTSLANMSRTPSPSSAISNANSIDTRLGDQFDRYSTTSSPSPSATSMVSTGVPLPSQKRPNCRSAYLTRIKDFNELEAYITNLYIFTGRLNRLLSRQGLAFFFIVHNLVITATLIVPEAISGGSPMVQFVRVLVVLIGIVPFIAGQALDGQLEQLSKQIDRIIIKQQFIGSKRDNLVRIRELLHDIRVNCGGMLDFNIETGIKYLVVAFATAFFIEQEDYKLTRRH